MTADETDEWGEWRAEKREEALEALRARAAVEVDLTDTAEGLFAAPTSETGLTAAVANVSRTLLGLLERA